MLSYAKYAEIRDSRGLKDSDVCKITGIAQGSISDWKHGRSVPKADKIQKIADALNCSVSILTGQKTEGLDYELSLNNNLRLMIEEARKLHENEQEYIVGLIKLLNSKHTKTPHGT